MAEVVEKSPQAFLYGHAEKSEDDTPEVVSCILKHISSTPFTFTGRADCELTPINKIKSKCNIFEAWRSQDLIQRADSQYLESPMQYRSFFLAECEDIARQLQSKEPEESNTSKRKIEELDISTIEAEPPPFYCTPKSTLDDAEYSAKRRRLDLSDKRNIKEGPSILGVTLLDLDKMTMEEHGGTCHKDKSVSNDGVLDVLQNKLLNTTVSIEKQEQQNSSKKTADSNTQFSEKSQILNKPFERNANPMKVNQNLKRSELLNNTVTLTDQLKINNSPLKKLSIISNKLQPLNSFTVNNIRPNNIPIMPPRISRNATKNAMDIRVVTTEAMKKNAAAHDTVLIDNGMTGSNRTQNAVSASSTEISVDITQDITLSLNLAK
eukprot:XP_017951864.1 PREDICTED: uncharacterized protein LOC100495263 [Xenopus tropicalis]